MPRNLVTDWEIIATSGKTVDGRTIEKKWLEDMAETYSPKVFSAKINLNHDDYFGSQGSIKELKVGPATEPQLAGEIHLYAKLCPSDDLVYANRRGKYVHSSIEVLKNFRGTGKFYLGGMAVTDTPASVGTSELHFSEKDGRLFLSGAELTLTPAADSADSEGEEKSLLNLFKSLLNKDKGESQDTAMDKEQFNKLVETSNKTNQLLETMIGKFASLVPAKTGKEDEENPEDDKDKNAGDGKFVSKKDHEKLLEQFTTLQTEFTELKTKGVPGTKTDENTGDVEAEI